MASYLCFSLWLIDIDSFITVVFSFHTLQVFVIYILTFRLMGSESLIKQRIFLKSLDLGYFLDRIRGLRLYRHKSQTITSTQTTSMQENGSFQYPRQLHMCFIQNNMIYNSVPASFHLHGSSQAFSQLTVSYHSNAHKKTLLCYISGILSAVNRKRTRPEILILSSYQKQSTAYSVKLKKSLKTTMAS